MKQLALIKILVFTFILIFNPPTTFSQATYTLQPDATEGKDAFIFNLSCASSWAATYGRCANTNIGNSPEMNVQAWTFWSTLGISRGLCEFNLSTVTHSPASLVSAQLYLYNAGAWGGHEGHGINASYIHRITSSWDESTVTWNYSPSIVSSNLSDPKNRVSVPATSTSTETLIVDITEMVRFWLLDQTGNNFGFMHYLATENTYRWLVIASSDHPNPDLHPKLVLTFDPYTTKYYSKSTGNLNILGTWGTATDGSGSAPGNFSQNNTAYIIQNNATPTVGANWTVSGNDAAIILGDNTNACTFTIPGNYTVSSPAVITKNNTTLTVAGTLTANAITTADNSIVKYTGSNPQNILAGNYYQLEVSGSNKTLLGNAQVKHTLKMAGNIDCNDYNLTLGTSISQTGLLDYTSGSIIGRFSRWFSATQTSYSFPVGTLDHYRPLDINYTTSPTTGGVVTVAFVPNGPSAAGLPIFETSLTPLFIDRIAQSGYWKTSFGTVSGGTYSATATANNFNGIGSYSGLRLMKRETPGDPWRLPGASVAGTGSNAVPVISRTGLTTPGGDFGVGGDKFVNPGQ